VLVAAANVEILRILGIPAVQMGSAIRLPACTVGIDEACSGVRSLQSAIMATLFLGHITLRAASLKIALIAAGVALAVIGNLGRSLFLSYTANTKGLEALHQVHDTAGLGILLFTAAGVALVAWLFSQIEPRSAPRPSPEPKLPS
jgi:exosortase